MSPPMTRLAVWIVRGWSWLYTWRMPPAARAARLAEIESDLWESQSNAADAHSPRFAIHLVLRALLGIPDDLGWRVERAAAYGTLTPRALAIAGRAAGGAVFICLLSLVASDARRAPAGDLVTRTATPPGEQMQMKMGGLMAAGKRVPLLNAGIAAAFGVLILPVEAQSPPSATSSPDGPAFALPTTCPTFKSRGDRTGSIRIASMSTPRRRAIRQRMRSV